MTAIDFENASLHSLAELLKGDDPHHQADAACTLGDRIRSGELEILPQACLEELIHLVQGAPFAVQLEAAITLSELQDPRGTPILLEALANRTFRLDAIRALGIMGDPSALPALQFWMNRRWAPWADRLQAAAALCMLKDDSAARYLQARLSSRKKAERAAAIHFVGESKHPEALSLLLQIAENPDDPLRDVAARSLGILGDPAAAKPLEKLLPHTTGELNHDIQETLATLADLSP
ncbi:MAG: HEAT repeat domain-containing protein [Myxococcota bacterium]|nr:HEAT repeat domain-containing protein [Myxococcota bacterium]